MNQFLKLSDLTLNPANYLTGNKSMPVSNDAFVAAQNKAHFIVSLSKAIVGKNFKHGKVDNLDAIIKQVMSDINNTNQSYGTAPVKPTGTLTSQLADEAMAFDKFKDAEGEFKKVNTVMQEFNPIQNVESVGDYFGEGVVKLNGLYDIATIQAAVTSVLNALGSVPSF